VRQGARPRFSHSSIAFNYIKYRRVENCFPAMSKSRWLVRRVCESLTPATLSAGERGSEPKHME